MELLNLNEKSFTPELENARVPVLVDFWAQRCPHCVELAPRLERIAQEAGSRAKLCKVNVDEEPALAARFGITSIPTMLFFEGGELTGRMVGARDSSEIRSALRL